MKNKKMFLWIALIITAIIPVYGQTYDSFMKSGRDAYYNKDYKKAIADFTEAIRLNPNSAEAYEQRGYAKVYSNLFMADKATVESIIADFTEVIRLKPNSVDTYFSRGQIYNWSAIRDYDKAIADFTQCIQINPNYIDGYIYRAETYYKKGEYRLARADLDKALQLDSKKQNTLLSPDFELAKNLDAELKKKGYPQALSQQQSQTAQQPKQTQTPAPQPQQTQSQQQTQPQNARTAQSYFASGTDAFANKDYNKAIADLTEVIRLNPNYRDAVAFPSDVYSWRAWSYHNKGDHNKAIADYDKAIELNPEILYLYVNRGYAYCDKGDYDKAIADFNYAIRNNPDNSLAYIGRGKAYIGKRNYKQAREDANHALQLDPNDKEAKDLDAELKKKKF